jgi:uncharacterized OsmC-like protein/alpha/beta superfamily hydrolase
VTASVERVSFPGGRGADLVARLDLPAGPARAFAIFAHCFTCGTGLRATSCIAAQLTDRGFGVLRFDFTGRGGGEGDFGNDGFASNVGDLVAAASWLREQHRPPQLLIGHSLGGSAALVAATSVPEVGAVATIAAPAAAGDLRELVATPADEVEARGDGEVEMAGRRFMVGKQLLDDIAGTTVLDSVASLDRALLVLHSPIDNTVGIENAARIYQAARHPKSFVSLDGADHLLSSGDDAQFAADIIGAWAARYLHDESGIRPPPSPTSQIVVAEATQGAFLNHVVAGRHRFLSDEPEQVGGFDAGPSPYDLLAAALGTCTSMTLRLYADRKRLPLDRVTVAVEHDKVHADDAAEADGRAPSLDRFTRVLQLEGALDDAQKTRLAEIAARCPVHRTLEQASRIDTRLA